jgi:hypothetical protein
MRHLGRIAVRVLEILPHAETSTRCGQCGRSDANTHRPVGERIFTELCGCSPPPGISVALILPEFNPETGLSHDRVLQHRGRMPLIKRAEVKRLTEEAKREIARAHAVEAAGKHIDLGRARAAVVQSAGSTWPWIAVACFGIVVFAALRGGP